MFAVKLKPLIYCDTIRLSKKVWCGVFRSNLLENAPRSSIHAKCFSSKLPGHGRRNLLILPARLNNIIYYRELATMPKTSPFKWKTVIITSVLAVAFLIFFKSLKNKKLEQREAIRNREIGKADLGGSFELVDQNNQKVKSEDFLGKWILLYFGFTHCPDICPEELEKLVEVIDTIDKNESMEKVKPLFITVDPERDTPGVIKKYLGEFSDKIVGLTGTVEQIAAVCKAYRVYFSSGPKDSDADYIVDHSIIMYLIDPNGNFLDYYGQNKNAMQIVNSIRFNQIRRNAANDKSLWEKAFNFVK